MYGWFVIRPTINPWVSTDDRPFRQVELGDLSFHAFIFKGVLFDKQNLLVITIAVDVRAEPDIALNLAR